MLVCDISNCLPSWFIILMELSDKQCVMYVNFQVCLKRFEMPPELFYHISLVPILASCMHIKIQNQICFIAHFRLNVERSEANRIAHQCHIISVSILCIHHHKHFCPIRFPYGKVVKSHTLHHNTTQLDKSNNDCDFLMLARFKMLMLILQYDRHIIYIYIIQ